MMIRFCSILLFIGILLVINLMRLRAASYNLTTVYAKAITSSVFVIIGLCGVLNTYCPLSILIAIGLLFALLGDIWLGLKHVFTKKDILFTACGILCFGITHICNLSGLITHYHPSIIVIGLPLICMIIVIALCRYMERLYHLHFGRLKPFVIIYATLLFSSTLLTVILACSYHFNNHQLNIMASGALLFALSDLILSLSYFGKQSHHRLGTFNYIFYYTGQYLIAFSLLFIH